MNKIKLDIRNRYRPEGYGEQFWVWLGECTQFVSESGGIPHWIWYKLEYTDLSVDFYHCYESKELAYQDLFKAIERL